MLSPSLSAGPYLVAPELTRAALIAASSRDRSEVAREAFGSKVVDHYLHHGRIEQQAFDQVVTDWELMRGFERI